MDLESVTATAATQPAANPALEQVSVNDAKAEPYDKYAMRDDQPTQILQNNTSFAHEGRLVLSSDDKKVIVKVVDRTQTLVGRADLTTYTQRDAGLISRSHFTLYWDNGRCMICDGVTKVQHKPSEHGTVINKEKLKRQAPAELKPGDEVCVSDVAMRFLAR